MSCVTRMFMFKEAKINNDELEKRLFIHDYLHLIIIQKCVHVCACEGVCVCCAGWKACKLSNMRNREVLSILLGILNVCCF